MMTNTWKFARATLQTRPLLLFCFKLLPFISLLLGPHCFCFTLSQDVPRCLKIITQISEMEINLDIIKKNPEIVQTIKKVGNIPYMD